MCKYIKKHIIHPWQISCLLDQTKTWQILCVAYITDTTKGVGFSLEGLTKTAFLSGQASIKSKICDRFVIVFVRLTPPVTSPVTSLTSLTNLSQLFDLMLDSQRKGFVSLTKTMFLSGQWCQSNKNYVFVWSVLAFC